MTPSLRRHHPPGTLDKPRRFVPRFHWELLVCGVRGHLLLGTDVAELRPQDALVAREGEGCRWHRCLRCDSWLPLDPPETPARTHMPERDAIALPTRGRALRDKVVLRAIAIDRAIHFIGLGLLSVAVLLFAANRSDLRDPFYRLLADLQGSVETKNTIAHKSGLAHEIDRLFSLRSTTLHLVGAALAVYATVEGIEAIGLWMQKRWAEYLTLIVTASLMPLEIYELTQRVSPFKLVALIVNLAVVIYLLFAKRLFGVRGGAAAEHRIRHADSGWEAIERTAPPVPAAGGLTP